jgi:hypothetical protein
MTLQRGVRIALAILAMLALGSPAAHAQVTRHTFQGATFNLPTPQGYCALDESRKIDALFAEKSRALLAKAGGVAVKILVGCDVLQKLRSTSDLKVTDYIYFYHTQPGQDTPLAGETADLRKALCVDMRAQSDQTVRPVKEMIEEVMGKVKVGESKFLGVLAEDAHGCHFGILGSINDTPMLVNGLATIVHKRPLFMTLYRVYRDAAQAEKSLAFERAVAADLDAQNPD